MDRPRRVILESPYSGDIERNIEYARACVRDCALRNESALASHLLWTQDGILNDNIPQERGLGIALGLAWGDAADATVVYTDLGITKGMMIGIKSADLAGRKVEFRSLNGKKDTTPSSIPSLD